MYSECKAVALMNLVNILKTGIQYLLPQVALTPSSPHFIYFLLHAITKTKQCSQWSEELLLLFSYTVLIAHALIINQYILTFLFNFHQSSCFFFYPLCDFNASFLNFLFFFL